MHQISIHPSFRRYWLDVLCLILLLGISGCGEDSGERIDIDFGQLESESNTTDLDLDRIAVEVQQFCGDCHATPPPSAIPKAGWFSEIQLMYQLYEESGRNDLTVPQKGDVVEYYRQLAPEVIEVPDVIASDTNPAVRFNKTPVSFVPNFYPTLPEAPPGIANLAWYDATQHESLEQSILLGCDMKSGLVFELQFENQEVKPGRRITLNNPSHSTITDLDQNGQADFLIADLGSFLPADHYDGRVIWLRPGEDNTFTADVLANGLGRVTDIQVGDFDQDGTDELLVAEFGWRATGNVWLLTQQKVENGVPEYTRQRLDDRHGVIHVPTVDINQDGHLDFVSVISQEHEVVELFLNRGDGTFRRQNIFAANSPAWGSTGIDLVDFDSDGDMDVLYTNGDIFDTFYIVPYHAAHWLENNGDGTWQNHVLGSLPGIHRAVAGDLDQDGDLDVVCSSLISRPLEGVSLNTLDSLMWFETTANGEFKPHRIETGNCNQATIVVADFDQDGDLDIATAQFEDSAMNPRTDVSIWWNNSIIPQ